MADEKIIINKIPGLFDTKLISGINIVNNFPCHIHHKNYCIGYIENGRRKIIINNSSRIIGKNDIFIINPNDPHKCESINNKPQSYRVLCIPLKLIESIVKEFSKGKNHSIYFTNFFLSDKLLLGELKALINIISDSKYQLEIQTKFFAFIEKIILNYSGFTRNDNIETSINKYHFVGKIQKYIDENFKSNISLNKLSELVNVGPFYLNRLFSRQIGVSLHSYHLHLKIEKSKKFLLDNHSIADAAYEAGFSDQSHFTKFFKKIIGVTPAVFVKHNRLQK